MIESIEFKNFKALRDTTLPLGRFTLIVGPNGSGKSTVLQALKVILEPKNLKLDRTMSYNAVASDSIIAITLHWGKPDLGINTRILWEDHKHRGPTNYGSLSPAQDQAIKRRINNIRTYALDSQAISNPARLQPEDELQPNGAHLAGVLDRLRDNYPERFEALNHTLGNWLPEFDRVLFDTRVQGVREIALRIRASQHRIPATELSQGTLLSLAMLTLAYLPDPPSIIGVEEPDRGIHPRLLRDIQDALYRLAYPEDYQEEREPVQVIATTHSPYFLDLFRDHPEEVVLANKTEDGTKFERLCDQPNLNEILEDSHLGEVWFTGILGGAPAHA